jgi:hypothetical protein
VILKKRHPRDQAFREVWTLLVDPADKFVNPAPPPSPGPLLALQQKGEPAQKLDLLILGDGFTAAERDKFEKDARRLLEALFSYSPFKERRDDFNVWGLCPPSEESGISRPLTGVHRRSRINATYDAFGTERYVLTFDNKGWREVASFAPYEFVVILVNGKTYGGGGIFGLYSTVASDSLWAPYVFVHELGHHLGGLNDEYFVGQSTYEAAPPDRPEPWEPNVTALHDPGSAKWKALLSSGVPVPTPWAKESWEKTISELQKKRRQIRAENRPESEMDALFLEEKGVSTKILAAEKHLGKVGAFEGANYEPRGYYRPEVDCVMFSRNDVPFCRVCQAAIDRTIDQYAPRSKGSGR